MKFHAVVLILALPLAVLADDDGDIRAGHSSHGDAFNEGPRQAAYLMDGMPDIDFPVTTRSDEAQRFFNQGVGQLHGFWYYEAERSFRQVAMVDTNCVMALWGMAMANVNNEKRARGFVDKALSRTNGLSRRECLYIESLARFYPRTNDQKKAESTDRHRQYIRSLEQIIEEFPEDVEAKALLAFKIWENNGRQKISSYMAADALSRQVVDAKPMHPIHHALIHLWNNEADRRALTSAAKCGQGSSGIAHMWHMPGHTYSALHRYADAAWQQEASARVDHAYMIRNRVLPDQIHNYAHNNEWLVKNLSYLGRVREAIDLAKNLVELPRHPKYNTLSREKPADSGSETNSYNNNRRESSALYGRRQLCEVLVRWELWDELIALGSTMYLERTDLPDEQTRRAKALGIAHFNKGDFENGVAQIAAVESALRQQKDRRQEEMEQEESKARKENKADDQVTKAMTAALERHNSKVKGMENALAELRVYQWIAEEKTDDAEKLLAEIKDIPKDRQAQLYLKLGNKEKALKRAKEAVESATNQVQVLANYVHILRECGKIEEAREQFDRLRSIASYADLSMPPLGRLMALAKTLDLPADWRSPARQPSDVGVRPPLDTLGPFRWHPGNAPDWVLRDSGNKKVALKDFRNRPVLVIFYLGHGCIHCIEQLNLFAPLASEYEAAGISIVAVSTDSVEGLGKTLEQAKSGNGFPFPLVSNAGLDIFKAYRAYDDFEKLPLHGTFLIDGQGLVRWQDISYEPFSEPEFLLKEAQRLLKLPAAPLITQRSVRATSPKARNL